MAAGWDAAGSGAGWGCCRWDPGCHRQDPGCHRQDVDAPGRIQDAPGRIQDAPGGCGRRLAPRPTALGATARPPLPAQPRLSLLPLQLLRILQPLAPLPAGIIGPFPSLLQHQPWAPPAPCSGAFPVRHGPAFPSRASIPIPGRHSLEPQPAQQQPLTLGPPRLWEQLSVAPGRVLTPAGTARSLSYLWGTPGAVPSWRPPFKQSGALCKL